MLKQNCCLSGPHFPPPAIVEVLQDYVTNFHKVRRLHLIVVDLWRPWKYNTAQAREITDQLWLLRDCRVSPFRPDGVPVVLHQLQHLGWTRRFAADDIQTQWQEVRANRRMQFKVGDYKATSVR